MTSRAQKAASADADLDETTLSSSALVPSRRTLVLGLCAALVAYVGIYLYYRVVSPGTALDCVGGTVIRPPWFPQATEAEFTFNADSRSFGWAVVTENSVEESVVSRISEITGLDIATPANALFYPAARIDHLFTGRYIQFTLTYSRPIFSRGPQPFDFVDSK